MDITNFFKQNLSSTKVFASTRFLDDDGNQIPFEIMPILQEESEKLKELCYKASNENLIFDEELYITKLVCKCVIYPDLNNAELQKNYGVLGEEKLIKTMLLAGEFSNLLKSIEHICGFNDDILTDIKKIKN